MASGAGNIDLFSQMPGTFFKMLGFGLVSHALGGILSGMVSQEEGGDSQWEAVNQGAFFIVVDVAQLMDVQTFKRQMDEFVSSLGKMEPAPGFERAHSPGGLEAEREQRWRVAGIPVGEEHQEVLERIAAKVNIELPW